jgi:hypothetical protein
MLIRIAPNMFSDTRFKCYTIQSVRGEIFKKQKFKFKYPWRDKFRDKIHCLPDSAMKNNKIEAYFEAISLLIKQPTLNRKKGGYFDLSSVDIEILSCALGNGYKITTGDEDLGNFALQEFGEVFRGLVSPLEMINAWIKTRAIVWSDELHDYLGEWKIQNEHPQPLKQIRIFNELTKRGYPGS